jgi:PAS domain S-box-containing protein
MSTGRILVAEDEAIVATAIKNELERYGYTVPDIAASAADAVTKSMRERPDLVLMDIHLKGEKDGIEAAREIGSRSGIPVVYLSAFADPETVDRAKGTEAYGYLLKPYEEQELHTTIEMALAKHRAEQKLAETQRWLAGVIEGIEDAVIATDPENKIRFMNLAAEGLTGWRKEEAVGGLADTVVNLLHNGEPVKLDDLADNAVCESRAVAFPAAAKIVTRSGKQIPVEGSLAPIFEPKGTFLGMALTIRDVTSRAELEQPRRQAEEQTRQSQKLDAMRRLAGGIAHHLNNLLTVMLGNTSLVLLRPFYEEAISEALGRIEAAGLRAADLIQRLMIFSGHGRSRPKELDLNALITDCSLEVKPLLGSGVDFSVSPGVALWLVLADEVQLGQALLNLLLAVREEVRVGSRITVETANVGLEEEDVANHPGSRAGDFVRIRVRVDDEANLSVVQFRGFEGLEATGPGSAATFGPAFLFAVVEQHRGWIACESESGSITRFDLYLPRSGVEPGDHFPAVHLRKPRGTRSTILLADADPMVRNFGRMILEQEGYQVLVAEDGAQAMEVFQQSPLRIDLAIIDLNIPRLSGDAVLERLVELDPFVRVLFSSGYFAEDQPQDGEHLLGVINKPYNRQQLMKLVRVTLAR